MAQPRGRGTPKVQSVTTLERLGATHVRRTITRFRDAVRDNQAGLNLLNVYPVPDGDTGTNMARTLDAVVTEMDGADVDMESTCRAISHGSLMGARGNSGVILSQILRGLADVLRSVDEVSGATVAQAFRSAATAAYQAVLRPIEGTILTVVREVAAATEQAAADGLSLVEVLEVARAAGRVALDSTPDLLPALRDAGVVDAGGAGFLFLIDAALEVVDGRSMPVVDAPSGHSTVTVKAAPSSVPGVTSVADLRYEVMFFLDLVDGQINAFKQAWGEIGDSIVVVGGDGLWNCHVHTNDVGAAIESALDVGGRPRQIRVTDLFEEVDAEHAAREAMMAGGPVAVAPAQPITVVNRSVAVVAVSIGDGLDALFTSLGVTQLVTGGQTMNPSTAELLAAVEAAPARSVVLLPNNSNIISVAERVNELTTKDVFVIHTRSMPEALAALVVYDPDGTGADVAASMTNAIEAVRAGEVTQAVRDAGSPAGNVRTGDWIGMAKGRGIVAIESTVLLAATVLLRELIGDGADLVTVLSGEGSTREMNAQLVAWMAQHHGDVEVEMHHGGQPLYPYLVGVE
jgi:uncharacterized protein